MTSYVWKNFKEADLMGKIFFIGYALMIFMLIAAAVYMVIVPTVKNEIFSGIISIIIAGYTSCKILYFMVKPHC